MANTSLNSSSSTPFEKSKLRRIFGTQNNILRIALAEFLGTFILCLIGLGAVHEAQVSQTGTLGVCLAFGFAVAFGVYASAGVSGGHINPAVTMAMFTLGKLASRSIHELFCCLRCVLRPRSASCRNAKFYRQVFIELAGFKLIPETNLARLYVTAPSGAYDVNMGSLFFDQIIGTWILITVIFTVIDAQNVNPGGLAPLLIGMAAAVSGLAYGANGGGAINPARDFGPRLFATIFYPGDETLWDGFFTVPLFGPLIGGALGALTYQLSIAAHWPYNAAPSKERDDVSL
ncbi:unnamed protein product [Oikopleura dioica]|uniref:Aquaporin n=1 Tax=Oikopleura dioica TaxID=34765 RepID=E4XNS5_OIKDI|nr:unnamed protein product [Oikopleura dioica]